MMLLSFLLLAAQAAAYDGHHEPPISPHVAHAIASVGEFCNHDVINLCSVHEESDPFLRWMSSPSVVPPPFLGEDIATTLNRMMDSATRIAEEQPMYVMISVEEPASEQVFSSMVSSLADHVASSSADEPEKTTVEVSEEESMDEDETAPAFDPVQFSKLLISHGKQVLESEDDEDRRRLARRLTEAHPDMFQGPRLQLPFGCLQNHCLMSAYEQGAVSNTCAHALRYLEHVSQAETSQHFMMEQEKEAFLGLAILYGLLCIGTLLLIHRRLVKYSRSMRGSRRLKRRILQAVYNNQEIKAAIESELHEDLGHVPPLAPHVLQRMSGKAPTKNWRLIRVFKLLLLVAVAALAFVNPFLAMPVMCIVVGARFFQLMCCPTKLPKQTCECCCCGVSTDDVKAGNVTVAQECCTCCKGTGVCSPNCAACCGDSGSCNCCCCCCGVSTDDVANGNVTDAQACCKCCGGTGKCCCCTNCCCSGSSAPACPKKQAYMAIPIQVV